ncbi:MAG: hypothetical protein OXN21_12270 [Chloroflexota bacterium]|nr:hypothetical protein [Chloroflexota bacterium]
MVTEWYNGTMSNLLFDGKDRDWTKPSHNAETTYDFYDRSALPEFERLRQMLQRWIGRLPTAHQPAFVSRMRHDGRGSATEEVTFQGAFFELFLHEFLLGTGGKVEVGPLIHGLTPDFGVTEASPDWPINYVVEATNVDVVRGSDLATDPNEQYALDVINEIVSPDYFLWIQTEGNLTSTPKKRDLKRPFEELIRNANYDNVCKQQELSTFPGDRMLTPSETVQHGDWTLTGWLIPVKNRPNKGRFVGIGPGRTDVFDDIGKIRTALSDKAKRYRNVDNLVIALRGYPWPLDEIGEALFGRLVIDVHVARDSSYAGPVPPPRERQQLDGFWGNSRGPQNENVIGVLVFNELYPQSVGRASSVFYANPYVQKLLPAWSKAITHAEYDYNTGNVRVVEGVPTSTFVPDHEDITVKWKH